MGRGAKELLWKRHRRRHGERTAVVEEACIDGGRSFSSSCSLSSSYSARSSSPESSSRIAWRPRPIRTHSRPGALAPHSCLRDPETCTSSISARATSSCSSMDRAGSIADWQESVADRLAESYRVVAFDSYGFGLSERNDSFEYGHPLWTQQAIDVLDALEIERAVVLGHSAGAMYSGRSGSGFIQSAFAG